MMPNPPDWIGDRYWSKGLKSSLQICSLSRTDQQTRCRARIPHCSRIRSCKLALFAILWQLPRIYGEFPLLRSLFDSSDNNAIRAGTWGRGRTLFLQSIAMQKPQQRSADAIVTEHLATSSSTVDNHWHFLSIIISVHYFPLFVHSPSLTHSLTSVTHSHLLFCFYC